MAIFRTPKTANLLIADHHSLLFTFGFASSFLFSLIIVLARSKNLLWNLIWTLNTVKRIMIMEFKWFRNHIPNSEFSLFRRPPRSITWILKYSFRNDQPVFFQININVITNLCDDNNYLLYFVHKSFLWNQLFIPYY